MKIKPLALVSVLLLTALTLTVGICAQTTAANEISVSAAEVGSETAKNGFKNEDEIAAKFNAWRTDAEAVVWLGFMGFKPEAILSVAAAKPHGEKADVVVQIRMLPQSRGDAESEPPVPLLPEEGWPKAGVVGVAADSKSLSKENLPQGRGDAKSEPPASAGGQSCQTRMLPQSREGAKSEVECSEGISIKLVSSRTGFNQIDKRWLSHYAKMWRMPADVVSALKLFVGEVKPSKASRKPERMFLNELSVEQRRAVTDFFAANKTEIVADLFSGDGEFAAGWMMVALKASAKPRWVLRRIDHVIKFFGEGPVEITRAGNLKIGRITMQRKGGDGGRESAKMLQFKIDPSLLFDGK